MGSSGSQEWVTRVLWSAYGPVSTSSFLRGCRDRWCGDQWRCRTAVRPLRTSGEADEPDRLPRPPAARRILGSTESVLPGDARREHDVQMNRREYCPIAASVEVLGDRWTPLIIREVMVGAGGVNESPRGNPRGRRTEPAPAPRAPPRGGADAPEGGR